MVVAALVGVCCVALVCVVAVRRQCRQCKDCARGGGRLRSLLCLGDEDAATEHHQRSRRHDDASSGLPRDGDADDDLCLRESIPLRSSNIIDNSIYFSSQTETRLNSKGDPSKCNLLTFSQTIKQAC